LSAILYYSTILFQVFLVYALKDDVLVEYATGSISNKLFVSKYQTYLPDKKTLQARLKDILEENDDIK